MSKLSPSRLQRIKGLLVEGNELTAGQREDIIALIDKETDTRQLDNSLSEFRKWICRGDAILTDVEKELKELRELTKEDGDTISRAAVFSILDNLYIKKPKSEQNEGVNWALEKVAKAIESLYAV